MDSREELILDIRDSIVRIYAESKIGKGVSHGSVIRLVEAAKMNEDVFRMIDSKSEDELLKIKY